MLSIAQKLGKIEKRHYEQSYLPRRVGYENKGKVKAPKICPDLESSRISSLAWKHSMIEEPYQDESCLFRLGENKNEEKNH
jgi:hypothetical protein